MAEWCNKYIRIPFKEHGRAWDGADCWGLFCVVFKDELGINLNPHLNEYPDTYDKASLPRIIGEESASKWVSVEPGDERPFDAVIFNIRGVPMHVGIVAGGGFMLHCERGSGTVFEQYNGRKWSHRIVGFCRYVE